MRTDVGDAFQYYQAIAAVASAVAAIAAAWAAYYGPVRAAAKAEELRQKTDSENEERRVKLSVYANLLGDRRQWLFSLDSIRSLNTIDLAFRNSTEVREAWAHYQLVLTNGGAYPEHEIEKREDTLLAEMAKDLGLAKEIRGSDIGRFSNPAWRTRAVWANMIQNDRVLAAHGGKQPVQGTGPTLHESATAIPEPAVAPSPTSEPKTP